LLPSFVNPRPDLSYERAHKKGFNKDGEIFTYIDLYNFLADNNTTLTNPLVLEAGVAGIYPIPKVVGTPWLKRESIRGIINKATQDVIDALINTIPSVMFRWEFTINVKFSGNDSTGKEYLHYDAYTFDLLEDMYTVTSSKTILGKFFKEAWDLLNDDNYLNDKIPGSDKWEIEKIINVKVKVLRNYAVGGCKGKTKVTLPGIWNPNNTDDKCFWRCLAREMRGRSRESQDAKELMEKCKEQYDKIKDMVELDDIPCINQALGINISVTTKREKEVVELISYEKDNNNKKIHLDLTNNHFTLVTAERPTMIQYARSANTAMIQTRKKHLSNMWKNVKP